MPCIQLRPCPLWMRPKEDHYSVRNVHVRYPQPPQSAPRNVSAICLLRASRHTSRSPHQAARGGPCVQLCRLQTVPTSSAYYGLALRVHPSQCRPVIHILPVRTCSVAPLSAAAGQHGAPSQMARWRGDNVPVRISGLRSHAAAKDTSEEPPMLTHGQLTWICARSST